MLCTNCSTERSSANKPDFLCSISSGIPEWLVDKTSIPDAIASISATGMPSISPSFAVTDGKINTCDSASNLSTFSCGKGPSSVTLSVALSL